MAGAWQRVAPLAVAGLLYISALLHGVEAQCGGGFVFSCGDIRISTSNGVLSANCRNNAGKTVPAAIELNRHLSNNNGELRPGSGFLSSCQIDPQSPGIIPGGPGALLIARCKTVGGDTLLPTYDVNRNIANSNGFLIWNNVCRLGAFSGIRS